MRVVDISRVPAIGTQVIVRHGRKNFEWRNRELTERDPEYSQFVAAAKQIASDRGIPGTLSSIMVGETEAQFSWSTNDDSTGTNPGSAEQSTGDTV